MMLAAEWGSGQVLWSMMWFFIFIIWIWLIIIIFSDIIRSRDMGGFAKAFWVFFIIVVPYLGIFVYLIARGGGMAERAAASAKQANEATEAYIRDAAGAQTDADELAKLADLHNSGKLDDAEYAAAKAKVLG